MRVATLRALVLSSLIGFAFWGGRASAQGPTISGISPTSGPEGTAVTITGSGFGSAQGTSTLSLSGTTATASTWTDSTIVAVVPSGAPSGTFSVTVNNTTVTSPTFKLKPRSSNLPLPPNWSDENISAAPFVYIEASSDVPTGGSVIGEITTGVYSWTSATFSNGAFTLEKGGAIAGSADEAHFAYQSLSGDGSILARVVSVQGSGYPQAGVMIRETLDAGARNAFTGYDAGWYGFAFADRSSTGGSEGVQTYTSMSVPYWVKLVRSGDTFTSYTSADGVNWVQKGPSATITMVQNVYAGLAVGSYSASAPTTATFDNVSVNSTTVPAPVITCLSATTGSIGSQIFVFGTGFGALQGSGVVRLNGSPITVNFWTPTLIVVTIPTGATSGPLVVSVAPTMNDSNPVTFTVTSQPLPSSWLDRDVGQVGSPGTASYASGVFTIQGSGTISGTADAMHFVYEPLSGDDAIVARVVSVQGSGTPQAGVMIRESLDAGAENGFTGYDPGWYGFAFADRNSTGGSEAIQAYASMSVPFWVKLVRSGNTFSSYTSTDGVNWVQKGPNATITMVQNVYAGLAVGSYSASAPTTATFDNVSISSTAALAPVITSVSATTGSVGSQVVVIGSGFGDPEGGSLVTLNNASVTVNFWSATSITVTIPTGATSGPLVVSVAPSMNDSNPVTFTVTSQPLPNSWLDRDVGQVGSPGNASYASGVFTIQGSGTISGTADAMHFVYEPLSGDGTIVARVVSVQRSGTPQAGVMIRESLDAGAENGFTGYDPGWYGFAFADRNSTGGSEAIQAYASMSVPFWVKLVRSGNTFSSYTSTDGVSWVQKGSATITMAQNVYVGLAVGSYSASAPTTATFDNVSVSSGSGSGGGSSSPLITGLSQTSGAVGTQVVITGASFGSTQNSSTVTFNGTNATVTSWSDTALTTTVPTGATTGSVKVTVGVIDSNAVQFTVTAPPTITMLSTVSGAVGTQVTITGTNFGATQSAANGNVLFSGTSAVIESWSDVSVVAGVPAGAAPGQGSVQVEVGSTSSNAVTFTVIPSLSATQGNSSVGDFVIITGANLGASQGGGAVNFGGLSPQIVNWNSLELVVQIPASLSAGTVQVSVTAGGITTHTVNFTIAPVASVIAPAAGQVGTTVMISGTALGGSGSITFNGVSAAIQGWSNTTVITQVPSGATTGPVVLTTPGAQSNPINFTVVPQPDPLSSIIVQPASATLMVGDTRTLLAVDNNGNAVTGASWSVDNVNLVSISSDLPPILTATAGGTITLTATYEGLTAQATWTIAATPLAIGTTQWSLPPDGLNLLQTVPAIPVLGGTADLFSIEGNESNIGPSLVRAVTIDGSPVWSAPLPPSSSGPFTPDALGGLLFQVGNNGYGGQLTKLDATTGQQSWAHSVSSVPEWGAVPTANPNGTIFFNQNRVLGPNPAVSPSVATSNTILALDNETGQTKYPVAVPQSYTMMIVDGIAYAGGPSLSPVGPFTVMPDGSTVAEILAFKNTSDNEYGSLGWTVAANWHAELDLLTIQPDGSSATAILDQQNTNVSLTGVWAADYAYAPGPGCGFSSYGTSEVIPDGQRGLLAAWSKCDLFGNLQNYVTHITAGTTTTYTVPYAILSNTFVLGDNNTAFAQTAIESVPALFAFDINSGSVKWTYQQSGDQLALIAATDGGGVVAKSTSNGVDSIIDFDTSGNMTPEVLSGTSLSYANGDLWLDPPPSGGPLTGLFGKVEQWASSSIWPGPGTYSRVPDPQITLRVSEVEGVNYGPVQSDVSSAIKYWANIGRIHLQWDGNITVVPGAVPNNGTCQNTDGTYSPIDITEDANASVHCEIYNRFRQPTGVQLLFNFSVLGGTNSARTSPANPLVMPPPFGNVATLGWQNGAQPIAHELGHLFQLPHENPFWDLSSAIFGPVPSADLMCGPTSTVPYLGDVLNFLETVPCTESLSLLLTPSQIIAARKGAQMWVSSP